MTVLRDRASMSTELDRIAELARGKKEMQFTSIAHLLTVGALERAWTGLRKDASAGVDGVTYGEYGGHLRENLQQLHDRLKSGQYRAQPLRRVYIPKEAGTRRPISIPALEDKIVQRGVRDGSILRLIGKWINVGVLEDGRLLITQTGVGQGQVISPLLANIYLHYVLDEWFEDVVKPRLRGQAYEIRYADDFILCFQYRADAEKVLAVLRKRFEKHGLTLHPDKTRLIEFGRDALSKWEAEGGPKPGTFDFLGFTHICRRSRRGNFTIHVRTMRKRLRRSLTRASAWCQRHRHDPVAEQWRTLNAILRGHYQYYGRPTNFRSLWKFYRGVRRAWRKWLNRRTRGRSLPWRVYGELLNAYPLQRPSIAQPWAGAVSHV